MKRGTKLAFFAFPFGDYEGVRRLLDQQAANGWAFAGRFGLITARFQATGRQELRYDVTPADPRRTPEQMTQEVQRREAQGWSPVDTLWGMDIYQSLPCRDPEPERTPEDYQRWRALFRDWLVWSLAFLAVTAAAGLLLSRVFSVGWAELTQEWYRSDSRTVLCAALPLGAVLALGWMCWLLFCLRRRCAPHAPAKAASLYLREALQLAAVLLLGVTLIVLWLDQIPLLWVRLALGFGLLTALLAAPFLSGGDRRRQLLITGCCVIACLMVAMVLGWTVSSRSYDTYSDGSSWRQSSFALLRAEDLSLDTDDQEVSAVYQEEQSLLWTGQTYYEHWSGGLTLEVTCSTCRLSGLASAIWSDQVPDAARSDGQTAVLSGDGWYQLWYRDGSRIWHLSGTVDWTQEALAEQAVALLDQ